MRYKLLTAEQYAHRLRLLIAESGTLHRRVRRLNDGRVVVESARLSGEHGNAAARGYIEGDGRLRLASLTPKGQALHDEIRELALERERALLAPLSTAEREVLLDLLRRLHDNLPAVEKATHDYLTRHYPKSKLPRARGADA